MKNEANQILKLLIDHYGKSKFYNWLPSISISDDDSLLSGEFRSDWQEIVLYKSALEYGFEQLATVINHEYLHYLQSPTWMSRYNKLYDYYNHPYEMEAYNREEEWRNIKRIQGLNQQKKKYNPTYGESLAQHAQS